MDQVEQDNCVDKNWLSCHHLIHRSGAVIDSEDYPTVPTATDRNRGTGKKSDNYNLIDKR